MAWDQVTDELVKSLKTLQVWNLTANRKDIAVRCPLCGDSKKHQNSCHLYIKLEVADDEPYTFYCQRCRSKGIVDREFLKMLRIVDGELNVAIAVRNKAASKGSKKWKTIKKSSIVIPEPETTKLNQFKLDYINGRLGTELGLGDLSAYKIVLNLYDLLDANRVETLTNDERFCDTLDKNFIGFVSYDNNYVILRNLSKKRLPDMRYYNYNIYGNYDNTKKFYVMPSKVDLLAPKLNVRLSEGFFDIMGVRHHVEKDPPPNTVFASANGVGYSLMLSHFAKMGFLDMDVSIYSDTDQPISDFKKIKADFRDFIPGRMSVNYNKAEGQKDFGVRPDQIRVARTLI